MRHRIPHFPVVNDRGALIVERCNGRNVLDVGCASGTLPGRLRGVAKEYYGFDAQECENAVVFDLDIVEGRPTLPFSDKPIEKIVCGEVLEHLTNPGWALTRFSRTWPSAEVFITVPNAFAESSRQHLLTSIEYVNSEHVAYYSWWTLTQLCERSGYRATEMFWYKGQPLVAEGLVFVCRLKS